MQDAQRNGLFREIRKLGITARQNVPSNEIDLRYNPISMEFTIMNEYGTPMFVSVHTSNCANWHFSLGDIKICVECNTPLHWSRCIHQGHSTAYVYNFFTNVDSDRINDIKECFVDWGVEIIGMKLLECGWRVIAAK